MNTSSHLGARHALIGLMPLVFYTFPAGAAPSFTSQPSVITENVGPNSAGFEAIHRLNLGVNVSDPLGVPGNIVSVEAIAQTPGQPDYDLPFLDIGSVFEGLYNILPAYSGQIGQWEIKVINKQNEVVTGVTNVLDDVHVIPLATNLKVKGPSLTPTISWDPVLFDHDNDPTTPDVEVNSYQIRLLISSTQQFYRSGPIFDHHFDVPPGLFFAPAITYHVRLLANHVKDGILQNRSSTFKLVEAGKNAPETIGLYDPVTGIFYLRNSNSGGSADAAFRYGPTNTDWTPLAGDWDGDGTETVGLYNPKVGLFHLKNSHSSGMADATFGFDPANVDLMPLAGDWDGNTITTVGLYDPVTSIFYLRNSNSDGSADVSFRYGPAGAGWIPLAGDWDGDGTETVGLYDPVTSTFYLRNSNSGGNADTTFRYGPAGTGWIPLVGDWDGDGTETVGLYDPVTSIFYLRNSNSGGNADTTFRYGPAGTGWIPLAGDWDNL